MTPEYRENLSIGLDYQDFVVEKLYDVGIPIISYSSKKYQFEKGENKAGLEIKSDAHFRRTGNLYIETHEKSNANNPNWIPSGILRSDNTWLWLQGDKERIYIFAKKHLLMAMVNPNFVHKETPTSKGFLMPVDLATKWYSIKIVEC